MAIVLSCKNIDKDFQVMHAMENFYKPLCADGYLTPLQRKKLRDKRNFQLVDDLDSEKVLKKSRLHKKNKKHMSGLSAKSKERFKTKRSKEIISQVQYSAAKIILRAVDIDGNHKKFFKASSETRLEKANFTMPFVFNKKTFSNIDKYVKDTLFCSTKEFANKKTLSSKLENGLKSVCAENDKFSNTTKKDSNSNNNHECLSPRDSKMIHDENEGHSENSNTPKKKSVFDFDWPEDELLLERQEKARAVMRTQKDPPKNTEEPITDVPERKLFPLFYITTKKQAISKQEIKNKLKNVSKKLKDDSKSGEQMIIDAGQKEIGAKICGTCNMIYTVGQEEDERLHSNYHDTYLINLNFPGWKEENVIGEYSDGRIILVRNKDKSAKLKKIEDILKIANRDLGFPSSQLPSKPDLTFVLFISNTKQVAGFLIAEPISSACKVLLKENVSLFEEDEKTWRIGNWYSSSETCPAICGINRIWVSHTFRRQKIASRMLDCLRCHFIHGHIVCVEELAFTDPSLDGRAFAASYTGTNNFLVYK